MDFLMLAITTSALLFTALFGKRILEALEPYECVELNYEDENRPIDLPILPIQESYKNIMQRIDEANTIQELNMALVDCYIFSGTYKNSEGLKNILLEQHSMKERELLGASMN